MEGVMSTEQDMLNHYMKNNLDKLKEIAKPRSKEAITKAAERRKKRLKDKEISCSAELMDQISFINEV